MKQIHINAINNVYKKTVYKNIYLGLYYVFCLPKHVKHGKTCMWQFHHDK